MRVMASNMAAIYKMAAQKAVLRLFCLNGNGFLCSFFAYTTGSVLNVSWSTFFSKMASNMAAIYKMAAQKAVFNGFRRGFLRTVPARSQMCHGQHFFQNGFQHGRHLQNGRSKSSFTAISPKR